jgi:hypothetical protein
VPLPRRLRAFSRRAPQLLRHSRLKQSTPFVFTSENFKAPELPHGLKLHDLQVQPATAETLAGYGRLISSADEISVERGNFEIVPWPVSGWRSLDPHTGDEAGTTEGDFEVWWQGDYFYAHNLAIASISNTYLDGLGALPEVGAAAHRPRARPRTPTLNGAHFQRPGRFLRRSTLASRARPPTRSTCG